MYINYSLQDYIEEIALKKPDPGGGSVASLVASLAASLTKMVISFSEEKSTENLAFENNLNRLTDNIRLLNNLIDKDSEAFKDVIAAYKIDKSDFKRKEKIERAYKLAMEVPFRVFKISLDNLKIVEELMDSCNKNLITDLAIAGILNYAAMDASKLNVLINLKYMKNRELQKERESYMENKLKEAKKIQEAIIEKTKKFL